MNADLLIRSILQQTMVFTAQLATAGGVRAPLASLANRVFSDLANELRHQGLTHSVIADMFGITLRSYHRSHVRVPEHAARDGLQLPQAAHA